MKQYYIVLLILLSTSHIFSQNTVKMSAVKGNNYGVAYTLPKTIINIGATANKTIYKKGEFYEYAEKFLNIKNPITTDETIYDITSIEATTTGVPDRDKSYLVEFKSGTTAPFVTLTKEGIICAINSAAQFDENQNYPSNEDQAETKPLPNPNIYLSEETLRAGSKAKQADLIAKQIFKLRETKVNILTGEADNMPPDGEAYELVMSQIDEQEKALTSMFLGTTTIKNVYKEYTVIPEKRDVDRRILFRFSQKLGFVSETDLSGEPVYLSLISREPHKEASILSPKEEKDLEKKFSQGIIYNIPGKADLKIEYSHKKWVDKECDITQFGSQDVLVPKMFDNNKQPIQVIFFPQLGAIKQIIQ